MKKSILAAFAVNLLVVAVVALGAYAWGYAGTITYEGVKDAGETLFGGIGAAISWVVGLAIFFGLLLWHNKLSRAGQHDGATALMGVSVIVAGFGILQFLQKPTDQIWALGALLTVAGLLTGAMWVMLVHHRVPGWNRFQTWRTQRPVRQPQPANNPANP